MEVKVYVHTLCRAEALGLCWRGMVLCYNVFISSISYQREQTNQVPTVHSDHSRVNDRQFHRQIETGEVGKWDPETERKGAVSVKAMTGT